MGGRHPDEYFLQVQHYMAVTGYGGCYIAALIGGNTFRWKFVPRDEELIAMLVQLEADFWQHVQSETPPPLDLHRWRRQCDWGRESRSIFFLSVLAG